MDILFYIVMIFIGFILFIQIYTRLQGVLKRGKPVPHVDGKIGKALARNTRTLLYFYTPTCSACKVMTPIIDRLQKEFSNILKINLANDLEIGKQFGVMGTPSLVLVEDQKIRSFVVGARNETAIRKLLEN
ncbi:MAG: thioredoxin family protein [Caldisericaceae bacterium]|nr:thioredoxin family protein [Caldisericaceae bacterium]